MGVQVFTVQSSMTISKILNTGLSTSEGKNCKNVIFAVIELRKL